MKNPIALVFVGLVSLVSSIAFAQDDEAPVFRMETGPICAVETAQIKTLQAEQAAKKAELDKCEAAKGDCERVRAAYMEYTVRLEQTCGMVPCDPSKENCTPTKKKAVGGGRAAKPLPPCADGYVRVWRANAARHECVAAVPVIQEIWIAINALKDQKVANGQPISNDFQTLLVYINSLRSADLTPESWKRVLEYVDKTAPGILGRIQALETRVGDHETRIKALEEGQKKETTKGGFFKYMRVDLGLEGFAGLRASPAADSTGVNATVALVSFPNGGMDGLLLGGFSGYGHSKYANMLTYGGRLAYLRGFGGAAPSPDLTLRVGPTIAYGRNYQPFDGSSYFNEEATYLAEVGFEIRLAPHFALDLGVGAGAGQFGQYYQAPEGWATRSTDVMPTFRFSLGLKGQIF